MSGRRACERRSPSSMWALPARTKDLIAPVAKKPDVDCLARSQRAPRAFVLSRSCINRATLTCPYWRGRMARRSCASVRGSTPRQASDHWQPTSGCRKPQAWLVQPFRSHAERWTACRCQAATRLLRRLRDLATAVASPRQWSMHHDCMPGVVRARVSDSRSPMSPLSAVRESTLSGTASDHGQRTAAH